MHCIAGNTAAVVVVVVAVVVVAAMVSGQVPTGGGQVPTGGGKIVTKHQHRWANTFAGDRLCSHSLLIYGGGQVKRWDCLWQGVSNKTNSVTSQQVEWQRQTQWTAKGPV